MNVSVSPDSPVQPPTTGVHPAVIGGAVAGGAVLVAVVIVIIALVVLGSRRCVSLLHRSLYSLVCKF